MKTVYFDESGQTGTNLFDRDQPFFTIGSTDTEPGEAADIIAACFPRHAGDELKSKRLFKQPRSHLCLIEFAKEIAKRPLRRHSTGSSCRFRSRPFSAPAH